jgi:hypothetical protein
MLLPVFAMFPRQSSNLTGQPTLHILSAHHIHEPRHQHVNLQNLLDSPHLEKKKGTTQGYRTIPKVYQGKTIKGHLVAHERRPIVVPYARLTALDIQKYMFIAGIKQHAAQRLMLRFACQKQASKPRLDNSLLRPRRSTLGHRVGTARLPGTRSLLS